MISKSVFSLCGSSLCHINIGQEFWCRLDGTMVDSWSSTQEFVLELIVVINNDALLLFGESKEFRFFFWCQTLELGKSLCNFRLDHWKNCISSIGHGTISNTSKSAFK